MKHKAVVRARQKILITTVLCENFSFVSFSDTNIVMENFNVHNNKVLSSSLIIILRGISWKKMESYTSTIAVQHDDNFT